MKMKRIGKILVCVLITVLAFSGCTHNVEDKEISISFNEQSISGTYTGSVSKGVPHGEGRFTSKEDGRTFDYTGQWEEGKIVGKGKLTDTKYVVHFSDLDRVGEYSGDVVNGKAQGNGSFTAFNDEQVKYTYTGSWHNGLFNGQGVCKYDSEDYCVNAGNFKDGEFAPDKLEFIKSIGDYEKMRFAPTEKAAKFIKSHENFFPADKSTDITKYIDKSIKYKNLIKSPDKYGDKLVTLSDYIVAQIFEQEMWNYTCTQFLAASPSFDNYVYVYYLGELPDVYEGSRVTIQGLPISNSSFENVGGGTTLCYVVYGCKIV